MFFMRFQFKRIFKRFGHFLSSTQKWDKGLEEGAVQILRVW